MVKKFILATLAVTVAAPVFAGVTTGGKASKELVEECKESWISGDLGLDVVSQYISRGLIFENQGVMLQPYVNLYFKVYEGDGFLNKITLNAGMWNSFHTQRTDNGLVSGANNTTGNWYEADFMFGASFTFAKYLTLTPSYYWFTSPASAFDTFQGINVRLELDDSEWLGAFALSPHVEVLFELDNKAGTGPDRGIYYQVGIEPALPAFGPLSISFPVVVGFGSHEFYEDNGLGYVSAGAVASVALGFIPEELGEWSIGGFAKFYYLDNSLDTFNAGADRITRGYDTTWVFGGNLSVAF